MNLSRNENYAYYFLKYAVLFKISFLNDVHGRLRNEHVACHVISHRTMYALNIHLAHCDVLLSITVCELQQCES
jgi:hypothetical protein